MKNNLKILYDSLLFFILLIASLLIVPLFVLLVDHIPYIFPINFLSTLINMRKGMLFSFLGEVVIIELLISLLKVSSISKNKNIYLLLILDLILILSLTFSQVISSFAIVISLIPHLVNLFLFYKYSLNSTILFIFKWLFILLSITLNIFGFSIGSIITLIIFVYENNSVIKKDEIYEKTKINNID